MSSVEEAPPRSERGILITIFAVLGGVATLFAGATGIASLASGAALECIANGQPRLICAAGAVGLVDLDGLVEKDRLLAAAKAEVEAKTAAAADLDKRLGDLDARVKELDGALAAGAAEAERLKGEVAKRDAWIAELSDRLATATKKPDPTPVPAARPALPGAPKPKP